MSVIRAALGVGVALALCSCSVLNFLIRAEDFTEPQHYYGELAGVEDRHHRVLAPETQKAFLELMLTSDQQSVSIASTAVDKAALPELRSLAQADAVARGSEATELQAIQARLVPAGQAPDTTPFITLGLTLDQTATNIDPAQLPSADPFDPAYIDLQIRNDQGAINLARALLYNNTDDELTGLANSVVTGRSTEIEDFNTLRTTNFGGPSPAGGVPAVIPDTVRH